MFLTTRTMYAKQKQKQKQKRRDSKLQDLDDDAMFPNPESYDEIYLEIPNECPIESFPSPSPALLEFCSDCDIELLLPSPVDTPQRRDSGNEQDADLVGLETLRNTTWEVGDVIEEEDEAPEPRLARAVTTLWRPRIDERRSRLDDNTERLEPTTTHIQLPTPEQRPESPDEFESTSQCATPRAQSFANLAALNTQSADPVTSRYAPQRGGPTSPIAPQSPTTSATPLWTADLADRTKQKRSILGDLIRSPPLSPANLPRDSVVPQVLAKALTSLDEGTIPPNSTPRASIATPTQGQPKTGVRELDSQPAQGSREQTMGQEREAFEDPPSSPEPDELITMAPKIDMRVKKGTSVMNDSA